MKGNTKKLDFDKMLLISTNNHLIDIIEDSIDTKKEYIGHAIKSYRYIY